MFVELPRVDIGRGVITRQSAIGRLLPDAKSSDRPKEAIRFVQVEMRPRHAATQLQVNDLDVLSGKLNSR